MTRKEYVMFSVINTRVRRPIIFATLGLMILAFVGSVTQLVAHPPSCADYTCDVGNNEQCQKRNCQTCHTDQRCANPI